MSEGKLTKTIMRFLAKNGWTILTFDYPQSGTGKNFKPSIGCLSEENSQNKNHIIPDILAVKSKTMVIFENKTYFSYDDFKKVNELITGSCYDESIDNFISTLGFTVNSKFYGIGCVDEAQFYLKAEPFYGLTDFVVNVDPITESIKISHNKHGIVF